MRFYLLYVLLFCVTTAIGQTPQQFQPITPHNASGRNNTNYIAPIHPQERTTQVPQQQGHHYGKREALPADVLGDDRRVRYSFPTRANLLGADRYFTAFDALTAMLEGDQALSLKEAVFVVEQAYSGDELQRSWYDVEIAKSIGIIDGEMKHLGYSQDHEAAKKMLLHAYMSGSLTVRDENGRPLHTTTSKKYDFEDINGSTNWQKMFVTKLMRENTGQCHSLPLLYLILAEELDIEAYLAFSPEHSYIKLKDADGNWINLELTNGHYTSDLWLLSSGYVKAEAVQNGIYMRPLGKKEIIAHCLVDLAQGYIKKYGGDEFVLQCVDTALQYDPVNIFAWQLKSDYQVHLFHYVAEQLGRPSVAQLPRYPRAYGMYQQCHKILQRMNTLGYEPMPEEAYRKWLKTLETRKDLHTKNIRP